MIKDGCCEIPAVAELSTSAEPVGLSGPGPVAGCPDLARASVLDTLVELPCWMPARSRVISLTSSSQGSRRGPRTAGLDQAYEVDGHLSDPFGQADGPAWPPKSSVAAVDAVGTRPRGGRRTSAAQRGVRDEGMPFRAPVAAELLTACPVSVCSGSTSKNDLNSPLNDALNAGVSPR